jgi:hypothetical protein
MRSLVPDFILLGSLTLILAAPAFAVEPARNTEGKNVSPAFDGSYTGQAVPAPTMSAPNCNTFPLAPVTITQGSIRSGGNGAQVQGFVTGEGFVTGRIERPGKSPAVLEGRFTGGSFSGGVVDDAERCAWTVRMAPT